MLKLITKAALMAIGLLANLHCQEPGRKNSQLQEDYRYEGNITYSLANKVDGEESKFKLLLSAPKGVSKMIICHDKNPTKCDADAPGYAEARELKVDKPRKFFAINGDFELKSGGTITLVALDGAGKAADYRVLQFNKEGEDTGGSEGGVDSSGGAGGDTDNGRANRSFRSAAGQVGTYRLRTPASYDEKKAYKAIVYFHGDNNSNFEKMFTQENGSTLDSWADENAAILVSLRTPDQSTRSWSRNQQQSASNGRYAHAFMQEHLLKKYNVDKRHTYFVGQSGGAIFLSGYFMPQYQDSYRGGALLLCGGEPAQDSAFRPSEIAKKTFQLYFHSTTGDNLLRNINSAIRSYRELGYSVEQDTASPGQHCDFNQHPLIKDRIAAMVAKNEQTSTPRNVADVSIDVSIATTSPSDQSGGDRATDDDVDGDGADDAAGDAARDDPDPTVDGAPGPGLGGGW